MSAALVIGAFTLAERGRAMAVYAGIAQVFLAVGPLLGGVLTQLVSWRAVFWINVPVGLAALVLLAVARPPNVRSAARDLDLASLVLLVCGLSAVVLGLQQLAVWGAPVCAAELALAARDTGRLRLGVAVTNPVTRHPAASAIATLQIESAAPPSRPG